MRRDSPNDSSECMIMWRQYALEQMLGYNPQRKERQQRSACLTCVEIAPTTVFVVHK